MIGLMIEVASFHRFLGLSYLILMVIFCSLIILAKRKGYSGIFWIFSCLFGCLALCFVSQRIRDESDQQREQAIDNLGWTMSLISFFATPILLILLGAKIRGQ